MEQQAGLLPVPPHRALRDAAHRSHLAKGEATEEFQIDQLRESRIDVLQLLERATQWLERVALTPRLRQRLVERQKRQIAATLLRTSVAEVVDHQAAHGSRGVREKTIALGKSEVPAPGNVEICLVKQRRRAERDLAPRLRHVVLGETMQLSIQDGKELIPCVRISRVGSPKEEANVRRRRIGHRP